MCASAAVCNSCSAVPCQEAISTVKMLEVITVPDGSELNMLGHRIGLASHVVVATNQRLWPQVGTNDQHLACVETVMSKQNKRRFGQLSAFQVVLLGAPTFLPNRTDPTCRLPTWGEAMRGPQQAVTDAHEGPCAAALANHR